MRKNQLLFQFRRYFNQACKIFAIKKFKNYKSIAKKMCFIFLNQLSTDLDFLILSNNKSWYASRQFRLTTNPRATD